MIWLSQSYKNSFRILHYILLILIGILLIIQLIFKQIRPINLLIAILIYIFIVWESVSSLTFKIIIIFSIIYMYKECINLLYFCFGEESDLADGAKLKVIGYGEVRNIVVVSGFWMGVMGYAILLSWRAYEKMNQLFTNQWQN